MKKDIYDVEGIQIEVERTDKDDKDAERRKTAYMFKVIREQSGMNRTEFAKWLGAVLFGIILAMGYLVVILATVVSSLLDAGRNSLATFMLSR